MKFTDSPIFGIVFVVAFLSFAISWAIFATRRLRPLIRQKLSLSLGVTINERFEGRGNQVWKISGQATSGQARLVSIAQFFTDFGCVLMPIFCALATMGVLMISLSDS